MVRRGPGMLGTMMIAGGTAAMVSNRSGQKQQAGAAQQQQDQAQQDQINQQQQQIDQLQQQQAPTPAPAAAPAAAPSDDIVDQLQKLGALKDSGALTPEEFEAAKTKLLGV